MINHPNDSIEKFIKTHTERSDEDRTAVTVLESYLRSDGRINPSFAANDKWPNHDGTFEFVPEPSVSRQPKQTFYIQIKGTARYTEGNGIVKYALKSLAFPGFRGGHVSLDPCILFVVLNPKERGAERVFWKYISVEFVNSIDCSHESITVEFSADEEIKNTDESVLQFCKKLEYIVDHHSFVNQLDMHNYTRKDVENIIRMRNRDICESIDRIETFEDTRDAVSQRMLTSLDDLCLATLLLNAIGDGFDHPNLQLAWEHSLLDIKTKYLGTFLRGLRYIGRRIPDEGQSERLMLKYYDFLWQIRKLLSEKYGIRVLKNLEKFPLHKTDDSDQEYYSIVAEAVESVGPVSCTLHPSRYYIQKKTPFFVGRERYYEVTLQLSGIYASKYNRITAYTKEDISSSYPVQIGYTVANVNLWGVDTEIKVITGWRVSIDPRCLNKFAKILRMPSHLATSYGEYHSLMNFLSATGMNLLELIDLQEISFQKVIDSIYKDTNTYVYKDILLKLREKYAQNGYNYGRNVIRYLLVDLREETLDGVTPRWNGSRLRCDDLYLAGGCRTFESNPFISNLAGSKTNSGSQISRIMDATGGEKVEIVRPYLKIRNQIKQTGEIYFPVSTDCDAEAVQKYNESLDSWEHRQSYGITVADGHVCINSYERDTLTILQKLLVMSSESNNGQKEYNRNFLKQNPLNDVDELKKKAIELAFVNSRVLLIYGAAGTGKTTLLNIVSNLMKDRRKLFLTKTHTALQNLKHRIDNPGLDADFTSFDSFTKKVSLPDYDIIFVDECSTIDNLKMTKFFERIGPDTFVVMAGDIHQIESIDFGNWFFYAKDIITSPGANIELLSTWRTQDRELKSLWDEVRNKGPYITEKLVIDGPFSENIGPNVLENSSSDEVILCLNYDGKFGLNNINQYFQAANSNGKTATWADWTYKVGDPILFNDSKRFPLLYNNLKGRIVDIEKETDVITFTIDVQCFLTDADCRRNDIVFIESLETGTRIQFTILAYDSEQADGEDDEQRMRSIIPFQLAYAVSIHKAQGLEYDSVKVIIPSNNVEKITHGVFYTAITRAKKHLKIYWSSETMKDIVKGFTAEELEGKSLEIVKSKLGI